MHDWEALYRYTQYHSRWFETPARYEPSEEYLTLYSKAIPDSWELRRSGSWYIAIPPRTILTEQGWKIHVSVRTDDAGAALQRALPILSDEGVCFKFLLDAHVLASTNSKVWPRGSSGKFITVYPNAEEHFRRLGQRLADALKDYSGPYILSDRRWPGSRCVFYRYGGFSGHSVLQVDGTRGFVITSPRGERVPDLRLPYWNPPEWADDPFPQPKRLAADGITLGNGRFEVTTALRFSNRGGVYKAVDTRTGRDVVIKESRPQVEVGRHRVDAIALLEKEWRLLERLSPTKRFVEPVEFFLEDDHAFLAEEFVTGDHIGRFSIRNNPLYHANLTQTTLRAYFAQMRPLWLQIAKAITAAHEWGIVLGDISFTNVIVSDEAKIRIIDLESALEEGVDDQVGLHTPGVTAPRTVTSGVTDRENDYYALGSIMFGTLVLANGIIGLHPPAATRFLNELRGDIGLPEEVAALINDLMAPKPSCMGPRTIEAIERLPLETAPAKIPRLASPPTERYRGDQQAERRQHVPETIEAVVAFIQRTADVERDDRLFPADLTVFETNPLSVAFGAAGVLYALHRLTGDVPADLLAWFLRRRVSNEDYPPGLYLGEAGIAWVLAELGYPDVAVPLMRSARRHPLLLDSPDVLCGAAGYGLACLKLWQRGLGQEFLDDAVRVGDHLLSSAVRTADGAHWPDENGDVPLGYAYGGSGVALFLLYLHLATGEAQTLRVGRRAVEFELARAVWWSGHFAGFPAFAVDDPNDPLVIPRCYWDAGSAGVMTTLARYLAVKHEPWLEEWVPRLATDVRHKYAVMPQLFHGLAGLGNALLDFWEQSGDEHYLADAWDVADGVLLFRIDRPEGVGFPGEQLLRESADFATGSAGIALFLDRLQKAGAYGRSNFNFVVDELLPARSAHLGVSGSLASASQGVG